MFKPEQPFGWSEDYNEEGRNSFIRSMKGVKMQLHSALMQNICDVFSVSNIPSFYGMHM
jgi:hypothetical protein